MIRIFLFVIFTLTFGMTCMQHFMLQRESSSIMFAYIGEESIRNIREHTHNIHADVHIFGRRSRIRSNQFYISTKRNPFEMFEQSHYSVLLIVWKIHSHLPLFEYNDRVIAYKFKNETIAIAWPKQVTMPSDHVADPLRWYKDMGGHVEYLYI